MWARTHLSAIQSITYKFVFVGWLHTSSYVRTRMCEFVPWLITHGFVCVNSYVWIRTMPDYTRVRMCEFACVNLYHACLHTSSYVWIRTMPILCYGRHFLVGKPFCCQKRLRLCTVSLTHPCRSTIFRHCVQRPYVVSLPYLGILVSVRSCPQKIWYSWPSLWIVLCIRGQMVTSVFVDGTLCGGLLGDV